MVVKADPEWVNFPERFQIPISLLPTPVKWLCIVSAAWCQQPGLVWIWKTKSQERTVPSVSLPLPSPLPHLLLSPFHPPSLHFSEAEASMDPLALLLSSVTWSSLRTLWTLRVGVKRERKGSSWWDAARQQQQAPLETASGLSAGDNPPGHDKTAPQPPNPPGTAGTPFGACRPQPWLCRWGWGLLHAGAADKRSVQPGPNAGEACGLDTWHAWAPQPKPCQESAQGKGREQQAGGWNHSWYKIR